MRILSVGSAFPEFAYSQEAITGALKRYWGKRLQAPGVLERLHAHAGVSRRHLAFPFERYERFSAWGETNRAWLEVAEELGARAIDAALERAALGRHEIDALFVVSVTGIASPSLDAHLINRMGLRPNLKRTPIFGLGCVGGVMGLTRAADYILAYPRQHALLLSVELCSLTMRTDDLSTVNLIATGLFGDGAVAAIVGASGHGSAGPEIIGQESVFYPNTEDIMGWDISEKGFGVVLSRKLPELIESRLGADVDAFIGQYGLKRAEIESWIIHPGGPKVLKAVEAALGLGDNDLRFSWECLDRFGNLSSGSVLRVLEEVMTLHRPPAGTLGLIAAMGPGFCSEFLLVRW